VILLLLTAALASLDSVYQAGDYERVVQVAPSFLADSAHTVADSINVNRTYAFALVALGRADEAAAVFRSIIAKDPNLTLSPESVSPKIRAVFESVRAQMTAPPPPQPTVPRETLYLRQPVPLSVLIPGLHQITTGRPVSGYALAGAAVLSLAGVAFSHFEYNDARAEYLKASAPADITARYNTVNNWSHVRLVFSATAVTSWLVSLVTALRAP
jgi:hypothetical protein